MLLLQGILKEPPHPYKPPTLLQKFSVKVAEFGGIGRKSFVFMFYE